MVEPSNHERVLRIVGTQHGPGGDMIQLIARTAGGVQRNATYDLSEKPKEGGAGIVFRDRSRPGYFIKLYKKIVDHLSLRPGSATADEIDAAQQKIEAMLAAPPDQQTASDGKNSFTQIAWPQEKLLTQDGRFVGFTMREIPEGSSVPLEHVFLEQQRRSKGVPNDFEFRLVAAQNLATVVNLIHSKGHAVVDLHPPTSCFTSETDGWG